MTNECRIYHNVFSDDVWVVTDGFNKEHLTKEKCIMRKTVITFPNGCSGKCLLYSFEKAPKECSACPVTKISEARVFSMSELCFLETDSKLNLFSRVKTCIILYYSDLTTEGW